MTTNHHDKRGIFCDNSDYRNPQQNSQHKNFNLNDYKCGKQDIIVSQTTNFTSGKMNGSCKSNYYSNDADRSSKKSKWAKDDWRSKPQTFITYNEEEEKLSWKNKSDNGRKSSTLSLYIAEYESSNQSEFGNEKEKEQKKKSIELLKQSKQNYSGLFEGGIFEVPRQQGHGPTKPEVMQFKASQRLLNPSASSIRLPHFIQQPPAIHPFFQARLHSLNPTVRQNSIPVKVIQTAPSQILEPKKAKNEVPKNVKATNETANQLNEKNNEIFKPVKDTKRKAGWDNANVIKLVDEYILRNKPNQMSELIKLLTPYFGSIGRTTVVNHVQKRKKELNKNQPSTSKENRIIKYLDKKESDLKIKSPEKLQHLAKTAAEIDRNCNAPTSEDPGELLQHQIKNIQNLLQQPQTTVAAAALESLLANLVKAEHEFKAAIDNKKVEFLQREFDVDLSFNIPDAPPVIRKPRGKKQIKDFYFGLNEKLEKRLLIVNEDSNNVREFSVETSRGGTTYYTCCRCRNSGTKKCRAILFPGGEIFMDVHHDEMCGPIPKIMSDAWQSRRLASTVAAKGQKTKLAFDEGFKQALQKNAQAAYGNYTSRLNSLSRWKGKYIPDCHKGDLEQHYRNLYCMDKRWLLNDSGNIVIFATDEQLIEMAGAKVLAADSTFGITPIGFNQTFFFHALIESQQGEHWVVTVMALMFDKEEKSYDYIFNCIKERWAELGVTPEFERIHADYEQAQANALKRAFGEDLIKGCLFHYDQCLLRRVGELGLFPYYVQKKSGKKMPETHRRIRTWVRSLMALPLLPKEDCQEFAKILCKPPPKPDNINDAQWPSAALKELADYLQHEWISKTDEMWNFNNLRRVRNTNRCEGFHSAMAKMFEKNPKLKIFMKEMQLYFTEVEADIEGIRQNRQTAYRNKKYATLDAQLLHYEEEFKKDISKAETTLQKNFVRFRHCRRVSHLLHEVRNKSCNTVKSKKKAYKGETPQTWKKDLQYIFEKDDSEIEHMFWLMESEEDAMLSRGEIEDDLEEIFDETFDFENNDDGQYNPNVAEDSFTSDTDEAEFKPKNIEEKFTANITANPPFNSINNAAPKNSNLIHFPKPPLKKPPPQPQPQTSHFPYDNTNAIRSNNDEIKVPLNPSRDNKSHSTALIGHIVDSKDVMHPSKSSLLPQKQNVQNSDDEDEVEWIEDPTPKYGPAIPVHTITSQLLENIVNNMRLNKEWAEDSPYLNYHLPSNSPHIFPHPIEDVEGDGNCGFRAVSKALTGSEMFHWDLRILATETLATRRFGSMKPEEQQIYQHFLPVLMELEVQEMPREYWCCTDHLLALAFKLRVNIATARKYKDGMSYQYHTPNGMKNKADPEFPTIYLKYNGVHFQVILPSH